MKDKQEILDMVLFSKLINKYRGKLSTCVNELHVRESTYKTDSEILCGWRQHFGDLAAKTTNSLFDVKYKDLVDRELNL